MTSQSGNSLTPNEALPAGPTDNGKRSRVEKACDRCRRMKLKCNGATPTCNRCGRHKKACSYTHESSSQRQERDAKALEARLLRMESLLRSAGMLPGESDNGSGRVNANVQQWLTETFPGGDQSTQVHNEAAEGQKALIDHWERSGISNQIFEHEVSHTLMERMLEISSLDNMQRDIFSTQAFTPLPPRGEVYTLVEEFFVNSNSMVPLYHRPTFMRFLERHYSGDFDGGSGWWACLNAMLASSYRMRSSKPRKHLFVTNENEIKASAYIKNALSVYPDLSMVNVDIFSAQALITMAKYFTAEANYRHSTAFVDAAFRILHSFGLHKAKQDQSISLVEMEQRRRIFWIAYAFDKEFSLRSGRPSMQLDEDAEVDLPSEVPSHPMGCATYNSGLVPRGAEFIVFRGKCALALVKSKIYKRLYSASSWKKTEEEVLQTVAELEKELDQWKSSLPYALHPDHSFGHLPDRMLMFTMSMRFAYYHCVMVLHRRLWAYYRVENKSPSSAQSSTAASSPQMSRSAESCVQAARQSIQLLREVPRGYGGFHIFVLYYAASSYNILFAHVLQNPQGPFFRADLERMRSAQQFAQNAVSGDEDDHLNADINKLISVMDGCERILLNMQEGTHGEYQPPKADEDFLSQSMLHFQNGIMSHPGFGF